MKKALGVVKVGWGNKGGPMCGEVGSGGVKIRAVGTSSCTSGRHCHALER